MFRLSFSLTLEDILSELDEFNDFSDIINDLLNDNKCRYYELLICSALSSRDEKVILQVKKWVDDKLKRSISEKLKLILAFEIQNLIFLDSDWVNQVVLPFLKSSQYQSVIVICLVHSSQYLYDSIVNYITSNDNISKAFDLIRSSESMSHNADMMINYFVAARYENMISEGCFKNIVEKIPENRFDHLIWTVIEYSSKYEVSDTFAVLKEVLKVYHILNSNKIEIILRYISNMQELNEDCWNLILNIIINNENINEEIWDCITDCVEKTHQSYGAITEVIKTLIETDCIPYERSLKRLMFFLGKIEMWDEIKKLAVYAVEHYIQPNLMKEFVREPKKVMELFSEIVDGY